MRSAAARFAIVGGHADSGGGPGGMATNVYSCDPRVKWRVAGSRLVFVLRASPRHPHPWSDAATSLAGDVNPHAVLILSSDPLAAALLGAAVELAGHAPSFAWEGELPRASLLRLRPRLVLVDCDHEDACSDAFVGPAIMTGAKVLLFRSRRSSRDVADLAARMQVTVVELPPQGDRLTQLLGELLAE
jgi:hypothetical protein